MAWDPVGDDEPGARITLRPSGLVFRAPADSDLLSAARAAGIAVPSACRNGVCELCEARLLSGRVLSNRTRTRVPNAGRLMLCRSQGLGDIELEIETVMAAGENPARKFHANVVDLRSISHDVYGVELQLPRRRELSFHAGQYLSVLLPAADPCYFSIASSPSAEHLELHIQATPEWVSAQRVIDALKSGDPVTLDIPHGHACLASVPDKPLVMVAAGTGFAQMKSMVDYLQETDFDQPVTLFWGVRRHEDMYLRSLAQQWHEEWPPLKFVPVVGDCEDNDWSGHHDQLVRVVRASAHDWRNARVMASGSPTMVYTLMDALVADGLPESEFFSDVLEYAPR
ncbi:MAG: 2Fe-2S iron-sulfur cluster-binding protein [Marinobacter sp.]|uniref:2Fe-2S iron-sulfur cluster-binding protein n=1 Tax=Marinobacter sp. TaxID=50741 RepID=UPI00299E1427|nr:2Fe-2S iron-sulfur cluster-binding protein [Marinobacter sp.]MDX1633207.1 2Fe-2S iron-sulfur cluster-binding protein [Marinobacter sp.]